MIRTVRSRTWVSAGVTALALTAGTAVVATSGRAPLSRSTPVNAASAQAPTTALFLLLLAAGTVMLASLGILIWSGRRRKDDEAAHELEPPDVPWIWRAMAVVLPFALAAGLVAAVLTGTRHPQDAERLTTGSGGLPIGQDARRGLTKATGGGFVLPAWLPWTVLAILLVAIAAGLVFLRARRSMPEPPSPPAAARVAVQAAIDALDDEQDPRAAVIAAYAAMEQTLADHGTARSPAEAPREFLRRVLLAGRATEGEATTLTALFEEARFSTHPIPERVRATASSALTSLRARLEATGAG
jgi:hypothetical protein